MYKIKLMLILLAAIFVSTAFAATSNKKAKDTSVVLKGEHKPAKGYKIYFSEDKEQFFHLNGYSRFDFRPNSNSKMTMPYFNFYLKGQTSKELSFNANLYFNDYFFQSGARPSKKDVDTYDNVYFIPGIYFARAYIKYTPNETFSIKMGRLASLLGRHDPFGAYYDVSQGIRPKVKIGDLTLKMSLNYVDRENRHLALEKRASEILQVAARGEYNFSIGSEVKGNVGITATRDFWNDSPTTRHFQLLPNIDFFFGEYYAYAEYQYKVMDTKPKATTTFNGHYEIGKTNVFGTKFDGDIAFEQMTLTNSNDSYNLSASISHRFSQEMVGSYSLYYSDFTNDLKEEKDKWGQKVKFEYYF